MVGFQPDVLVVRIGSCSMFGRSSNWPAMQLKEGKGNPLRFLAVNIFVVLLIMMDVELFPPRESFRRNVSVESRYGI